MSGSDYSDLAEEASKMIHSGICVHGWSPEMLFEEPPNGDDGGWCIATICIFCSTIRVKEIGKGEYQG